MNLKFHAKLMGTGVIAALLMGGCGKKSETAVGTLDKVRVGYVGLTCEAPIFAAVEKGFLRKRGSMSS